MASRNHQTRNHATPADSERTAPMPVPPRDQAGIALTGVLVIAGCTGLIVPLIRLLNLIAWPASSVATVSLTWVTPTSLRLQGHGWWRGKLRGLALGTDRKGLKACILIFLLRAVWLLLEKPLNHLFLIGRLVPAASVVACLWGTAWLAQVIAAENAMSFERKLAEFHGRIARAAARHVTKRQWEIITKALRLQDTSSLSLALAVAGPVLGILWSGAPSWLLSWVILPFLRLSIMLYIGSASILAVLSPDTSAETLREWLWFWLLEGTLMHGAVRVLWLPKISKAVVLVYLRGYLLFDRGRTLPYVRRLLLALKLFVSTVPLDLIDELGDSQLGAKQEASVRRHLLDAWRLSGAVRSDSDARSTVQQRWRDAARAAVSSATPPSTPHRRAPTPDPRASATAESPVCGHVGDATECVVLFTEIARGEPRATCPDNHATCAEAFEPLFQEALSRRREELSEEECRLSRYLVRCHGGCGKCFSVKETTSMLTEAQADTWEQANKKLFKDLNFEDWLKLNLEQGAEEKRIEEIRAAFRNANGEYKDAYQCPVCKFGPKPLMACDDLNAHHGQVIRNPRTGAETRIDNGCTRCGWFGRHISMWEPWDGTVPTLDDNDQPLPAVPLRDIRPTPAEEALLAMGYAIETIRTGHVLRALRRAAEHTDELDVIVSQGIAALENDDDDDGDDDGDDDLFD